LFSKRSISRWFFLCHFHLTCYPITGQGNIIDRDFTFRDQFGLHNVTVTQPFIFCQTANKTASTVNVQIPQPIANHLHFNCYNATNLTPISLNIGISDQLDPLPELVSIRGPTVICAPTEKAFPPVPLPPLMNNNTHLTCYDSGAPTTEMNFNVTDQFNVPKVVSVKTALQFCETATKAPINMAPPPVNVQRQFNLRLMPDGPFVNTNIDTQDQFNNAQVNFQLAFSNFLLVPAQKSFGMAIGGEIIPLDSTMILLAGTHSVAAWMIPVIVSGIGIAVVIARKF